MDANATTPLLPEVLDAMRPFLGEAFGNASSIHQRGQHARASVDCAREQVAHMLGCRAAEIVFTSGGTESDNLALSGVVGPGDRLIVSAVEHHAVLHAADELARRGVDVVVLPCNASGVVQVETLEESLAGARAPERTTLVSVMLANNETGAVQPVSELAAAAHRAGALFHTDAVQGASKVRLDVADLGCDLLTLTGHKMYAPQGVGVLFVRKNVRLRPAMFGGMHERGRRPGTENVAGIVGLGRAAELAEHWLADAAGVSEMQGLRDRLEQGILAAIGEAGVNGGNTPRTANTSNLWFDGVEAEALVIALDLKGLAVSGGSACQSGATEPSHVLTAMGLSEARARASVRFSLSRMTTLAEVEAVIEMVPRAVSRLRELMPRPRELAVASL